ncbi:hypothetical protein LTR22_007567 [Elasticomyces elasticus]|nr:hypothetical protein LTR22_007567 [Elasticomyces elasticus]KAK5765389.1 hypothetical protein LTS12_004402 [Elasticomyces elasticus]
MHCIARPYLIFPPRQYTDLTKADITALAPVLMPSPSGNTSEFIDETKQLITDLPSHLRCKVPRLTTLCSTHKRLNPLPLISLNNSIERDIEHELQTHWTPLTTEGTLTATHEQLITRLRSHVRTSECAACAIASLAADPELAIAIGAIMIATLSPGNWQKSKRVFFLECQLDNNGDEAEAAKEKMFELGSQLRRIREALRSSYNPVNRPHVAEAIAKHYDARTPPPRPQRYPEQDDHVSIAASLSSKGGRLDVIAAQMAKSPTESVIPYPPEHYTPPPPSTKPNFFDNAFKSRQTWRETVMRDYASPASPEQEKVFNDGSSSIYSKHQSSVMPPLRLSTKAGSFIPPLRLSSRASSMTIMPHHSPRVVDLCGDNSSETHLIDGAPAKASRRSRLARYSRQKLAPVWIPRGQDGQPLDMKPAVRTSGLWSRRFEAEEKLGEGWEEVKTEKDAKEEKDRNDYGSWF